MKRSGIALLAAGVAAACLVGTVTGDAAGGTRRRRAPKPVVSDVRIGDGGIVVTSEASPGVVVRFRLSARRRASVAVRFELGMDHHSNGDGVDGYIDETEFSPAGIDLDAPEGTSVLTTRGGWASTARFEASPEGIEHVAVWRARDSLFGGRLLATLPRPAGARPDGFDFVPSTRPVLRITPRRGTAAARAFEYDGNSAPVLTLVSFESGPLTVIRTRVADPDSEDLNGDGNLDPLDGEDRNGDGVLQAEFIDLRVWWVRVGADVDPASMSPEELLRFGWRPCMLLPSPDRYDPEIDGFASPGGRPVPCTWDTDADVPGEAGPFLLGVTAYDPKFSSSGFQVFPTPVVIPR